MLIKDCVDHLVWLPGSVLLTIRWSDKGTYVSFINWEEFKDLAEKLIKGKITEEQFNEGIKTKE